MPPVVAAVGIVFTNVGLSVGLGTLSWTLGPAIGSALVYGGLSIGLSYASTALFTPDRPDMGGSVAPKPADGKHNLRQNVPSLAIILGRVKKGGDYDALEEKGGVAYHVIVHAAHRIEGYVRHYLHDEPVSINGSGGVTDPGHFNEKVTIKERLGLDAETAYSEMVSAFPTVWSVDHRGDGLASILMMPQTVAQEVYLDTYPHQMPMHTAIIDGAGLYDPRTETTAFSRNLALFRLFHLTHPSGVKLTMNDIYIPDWINAANVCDESVANVDEETEARYHGGIWYRYENDPVQIGRLIDQAAELVVYERPDGKIGVHAGEYVPPDVRLTTDDIVECSFDANKRSASNVLAVRGRFTDPNNTYNTVDAAIFGNPYVGDDDTQRTRTVDNQVVQSHNHCQRLQKLAFTRANAPRVKIIAHYEAAKDIPYRRFVKVHYPPRLDEAIIEVLGRPRLSLHMLRVEFEGIVVPSTLYDFDAETEEGEPPAEVVAVEGAGVPAPENFGIATAALIVAASWDFVSDTLVYELEMERTDETEPPQSVMSKAGETEVRTAALFDGVEYRFRLRAWSSGASSDWTYYETVTVIADNTAPGQPTNFASSKAGSDIELTWTNPNSSNLFGVEVYRNTTNNLGTASLIAALYGGIGEAKSYADESLPNNTYYWWIVAINASGVAATEVGPETQTIP